MADEERMRPGFEIPSSAVSHLGDRKGIRPMETCAVCLEVAQRDGRPVEYRWRPLFNAANFG